MKSFSIFKVYSINFFDKIKFYFNEKAQTVWDLI